MKKILSPIALLFLVALASCGYHFEGGGYINRDVAKVAVTFFENNTSETGASMVFTNALIEEISSKTDTRVVDESEADAVLKSRINSIVFSVLTRSTTDSVTERRVTATVNVTLVDKDGKKVWSVQDFSSTEDYTVSSDTVTDEGNKKEAIDKIAVRVAERLVSKLLTNF